MFFFFALLLFTIRLVFPAQGFCGDLALFFHSFLSNSSPLVGVFPVLCFIIFSFTQPELQHFSHPRLEYFAEPYPVLAARGLFPVSEYVLLVARLERDGAFPPSHTTKAR